MNLCLVLSEACLFVFVFYFVAAPAPSLFPFVSLLLFSNLSSELLHTCYEFVFSETRLRFAAALHPKRNNVVLFMTLV